jgi:hypothetical protein
LASTISDGNTVGWGVAVGCGVLLGRISVTVGSGVFVDGSAVAVALAGISVGASVAAVGEAAGGAAVGVSVALQAIPKINNSVAVQAIQIILKDFEFIAKVLTP